MGVHRTRAAVVTTAAVAIATLAAVCGLLLPVGTASGQQTQTRIFRSTFETVAPSTPFDVVTTLVEFAPGAWAPPHVHSAPSFLTLLEGELTLIHIVDGERTEPMTYKAGDAIVEPAWHALEAGNLSTQRVRVLLTRLQPKESPATIELPIASYRPGAPRLRPVYEATSEVINISGPVDLHHRGISWPPGGGTRAHFHAGSELAIVTNGELTVTNVTKGTEQRLRAGDQFVNGVGQIHATANNGSENAAILATYVIASGQPFLFWAE